MDINIRNRIQETCFGTCMHGDHDNLFLVIYISFVSLCQYELFPCIINTILHSSSILNARLVSGDGGDHPIQARIHGDKGSFRIKDLKRLGSGIFRERSNIRLDAYIFQQEKYLEAISTQPKVEVLRSLAVLSFFSPKKKEKVSLFLAYGS